MFRAADMWTGCRSDDDIVITGASPLFKSCSSVQNINSLRIIEKGAFTDLPRLEYL